MKKTTFTRRLAISLAALIMMTIAFGGTASATTAQYATTQSFLDYADSIGLHYTYNGMMDNGESEHVSVGMTLNNMPPLTCQLFFLDDEVSLRIWNIVTVTAGRNHTLETVNTLNESYKYVKFVYDPDDSTLQCELDMPLSPDCGTLVAVAMLNMFRVIDDQSVASVIKSLE